MRGFAERTEATSATYRWCTKHRLARVAKKKDSVFYSLSPLSNRYFSLTMTPSHSVWLWGWFFASINVCGRTHRTELTPFSALIYNKLCVQWVPRRHFHFRCKRKHVRLGEATNTWIHPLKAKWKVENRSTQECLRYWKNKPSWEDTKNDAWMSGNVESSSWNEG